MASFSQVEQKHTLLDCVNCLRDASLSCVSQNTWPTVVAKYTTSRWVWDVRYFGCDRSRPIHSDVDTSNLCAAFASRSFRLHPRRIVVAFVLAETMHTHLFVLARYLCLQICIAVVCPVVLCSLFNKQEHSQSEHQRAIDNRQQLTLRRNASM